MLFSRQIKEEDGRRKKQLNVVDVETSRKRVLTEGTAMARGLAGGPARWSPDGRKVAFVAEKQGVPLVPQIVQSAPDHKDETVMREPLALWVAEADGSEETQITHAPGCDDGRPTWSPDGAALAFDRFQSRKGINIFTVWVDGTEPQQLTDYGRCMNPAWSPTGDWIAYYQRNSEDKGKGELWLVDPATGTQRRIIASTTHPVAWNRPPIWDREGKRIFFVSEGDLFVVEVAGGDPTQLTRDAHLEDPHEGGSLFFSLSPDGTQLAFSQPDRGNMQQQTLLLLPLE